VNRKKNRYGKLQIPHERRTEEEKEGESGSKVFPPSESGVSGRVLNTIVAVTRNVIGKLTRGDFNASPDRALPRAAPPIKAASVGPGGSCDFDYLHCTSGNKFQSIPAGAACRRIGTSAARAPTRHVPNDF